MDFPLYRKYSHNRTYFKIHSKRGFEELTIIGNSYSIKQYEVKIFSDRVFMEDMLENKNNHWVIISEAEYKEKKEYCLSCLKPF